MPSKVSSVPVGGKPTNSPLMRLLSVYLVTTVSPSAICSSMLKLMIEKASRISVTDRLKSSRVGPCPGSRPRSTKSGLSSSSITSRFPLACSSKKRRTSALFSSSDTELRPPCTKPTFRRRVPRNQTMVQPTMHSGTPGRSFNSEVASFTAQHLELHRRLSLLSACMLVHSGFNMDSSRFHRPLLPLPRFGNPLRYGTLAGKRGAGTHDRGQVRWRERQDDPVEGGSRLGGGARASRRVSPRRARSGRGGSTAERDGACTELSRSQCRSLSTSGTVFTLHGGNAEGVARVSSHAFCWSRAGRRAVP